MAIKLPSTDNVHFLEGHNGNPTDGFGKSTYNPIKASSIESSYQYLWRLRKADGENLLYTRVATFNLSTYNSPHIIDCYKIRRLTDSENYSFNIYIDCYAGYD